MITGGKWTKTYCLQVGLDDYDGCEIPLERMDDFEPEETYIIPNPVLAEKGEEETGDSVVDNQLDNLVLAIYKLIWLSVSTSIKKNRVQ